MTSSHTAPLLAFGGLLTPAGGALMAVTAFIPKETSRSIWDGMWFDLGFGCVVLGFLIGSIGIYLHFRSKEDRASREPIVDHASQEPTVTLLGGTVTGNSRLDIESTADRFAAGTTFTGNSDVKASHRPDN